jgi:hypothetical protein
MPICDRCREGTHPHDTYAARAPEVLRGDHLAGEDAGCPNLAGSGPCQCEHVNPSTASPPDRSFTDDLGRTWEWCGGVEGTWAWRITRVPPPTGGTFTVSINGGVSDPLPHDASAEDATDAIQQAWERGEARLPPRRPGNPTA